MNQKESRAFAFVVPVTHRLFWGHFTFLHGRQNCTMNINQEISASSGKQFCKSVAVSRSGNSPRNEFDNMNNSSSLISEPCYYSDESGNVG
jgi:hypothetical protein